MLIRHVFFNWCTHVHGLVHTTKSIPPSSYTSSTVSRLFGAETKKGKNMYFGWHSHIQASNYDFTDYLNTIFMRFIFWLCIKESLPSSLKDIVWNFAYIETGVGGIRIWEGLLVLYSYLIVHVPEVKIKTKRKTCCCNCLWILSIQIKSNNISNSINSNKEWICSNGVSINLNEVIHKAQKWQQSIDFSPTILVP